MKKEGRCFYVKGLLKEQYYNDIDIGEIIRFGGTVLKIHEGIGFPNSIESPFIPFVTKFFDQRKVYMTKGDNFNKILGDATKLMLNSCYGKTVQKDIDTQEGFTTQ